MKSTGTLGIDVDLIDGNAMLVQAVWGTQTQRRPTCNFQQLHVGMPGGRLLGTFRDQVVQIASQNVSLKLFLWKMGIQKMGALFWHRYVLTFYDIFYQNAFTQNTFFITCGLVSAEPMDPEIPWVK